MLVQRQRGAVVGLTGRGMDFDRVIVGDEGGQPAVGDPLQQALVAAVEDAPGSTLLVQAC